MRIADTVFAILLGLAMTSPLTARLPQEPAQARSEQIEIASHVHEASQRFGLPEHWIYAVIRSESAGRVRAVSRAGAMGLMQLMPGTWARQRDRFSLGSDPFDPRDNILAGTSYLREMYDRYGVEGFLAAYNAGPGRYEDWLAGRRNLPRETRLYVARTAPLLQRGCLFVAHTVQPERAPSGVPLGARPAIPDAASAGPEAAPPPRPAEPAHDLFVPVSTAIQR